MIVFLLASLCLSALLLSSFAWAQVEADNPLFARQPAMNEEAIGPVNIFDRLPNHLFSSRPDVPPTNKMRFLTRLQLAVGYDRKAVLERRAKAERHADQQRGIKIADESAKRRVAFEQGGRAHLEAQRLREQTLYEELTKFIKGRFITENLNFLNAVLDYRNTEDETERNSKAQNMMERFIKTGVDEEINISSDMRKAIVAKKHFEHNDIEGAFTEIRLMTHDNFRPINDAQTRQTFIDRFGDARGGHRRALQQQNSPLQQPSPWVPQWLNQSRDGAKVRPLPTATFTLVLQPDGTYTKIFNNNNPVAHTTDQVRRALGQKPFLAEWTGTLPRPMPPTGFELVRQPDGTYVKILVVHDPTVESQRPTK